VEGENGGTEVGLLALGPGTGPAFDAAGTAAVEVAFCVDVDVGQVSRFDAAGSDGDCFEDHR
jgi:hypothetical protein